MKRFKLIDLAPKRSGTALLWIGFLLLAASAADQFYFQRLGSMTMIGWGLGGLLILLGIVIPLIPSPSRNSHVLVEDDGIIVNYRGYELPIPYEDIQTLAGGKVSQHHSFKNLSSKERAAIKPYFNQTQVFVELHQESDELKEAKQYMPSFMFGTTQVGLMLLVEGDWIPLERATDEARMAWMHKLKRDYEESQKPKSDAWYDQDYEDEDDEGFEF